MSTTITKVKALLQGGAGSAVSWATRATFIKVAINHSTGEPEYVFRMNGTPSDSKPISMNTGAVEALLSVASHYTTTEYKTRGEIQDLVKVSQNTSITVGFFGQDKVRTHIKKAKQDAIKPLINRAEEIKNIYDSTPPAKIDKAISDWTKKLSKEAINLLENPITPKIAGEFKIREGVHEGQYHSNGDLKFYDQKADTIKHLNLGRTLMVIVGGVRYIDKNVTKTKLRELGLL